jgi:hypothetical protein
VTNISGCTSVPLYRRVRMKVPAQLTADAAVAFQGYSATDPKTNFLASFRREDLRSVQIPFQVNGLVFHFPGQLIAGQKLISFKMTFLQKIEVSSPREKQIFRQFARNPVCI